MSQLCILDIGGQMSQGSRGHQEDRCKWILPEDVPTEKGDQLAYLAVFDGHGSDEASEIAQQRLHHRILDRDEFKRGQYEKAIILGLKDIDDQLYERFKDGNNDSAMCGCTVALCLLNLTEGHLLVANLGDSPIILGKRSDAKSEYNVERISRDHKPTDPKERDRIENAGGSLNLATGEARLGSMNMTRALGDLQLKRPLNETTVAKGMELLAGQSAHHDTKDDFMSHMPFMASRKLSPSDQHILILASDGLTDALDDNGLMKLVSAMKEKGHSAQSIAGSISELVGQKKNSDNCTCIIAFLGHQN